MSPADDSVAGNAPEEFKEQTRSLLQWFTQQMNFAPSVLAQLQLTGVSMENEGRKQKATVTCEIVTGEDMLNGLGTMHGGCIAYLVDVCTTIPIMIVADGGDLSTGGVSQTLSIVYHSPATLGSHLRIVSTIVSRGRRVVTVQCEVWDIKKNAIVASGTHIKMAPSSPKAKL
ncbi:hypothetical protein BOTBODRAFT_54767 [Botryobasidium botryosum FD-172 SS1]|uniref:Thioesterase domain-containing protein n=1 Tax=Botryobasidium botryosum (strain FD-172 SS1) TaxID=930990 RepID=A0A067ML99_BOTB1|nr:hypothetical protein BOTBODRAFT_54767 [Botryobasidium botryosum FD-172 SS1]